jgi:phospholipid/cholesterol/gamma-HCH transport system permease protein
MNWLTEQISAVGAWVLNQIVHTGRFGRFSWQVIRKFPASLKRFSIVVQQMMFLGNHSLLIIAVSGFFIGAVLGLQGYDILVTYGSEEALGVLVALALIRELGPVVTALCRTCRHIAHRGDRAHAVRRAAFRHGDDGR